MNLKKFLPGAWQQTFKTHIQSYIILKMYTYKNQNYIDIHYKYIIFLKYLEYAFVEHILLNIKV